MLNDSPMKSGEQLEGSTTNNVPLATVVEPNPAVGEIRIAEVITAAEHSGVITSLAVAQQIVHEGDLIINCDIPPSVKIHVLNGSLTVNGSVGDNVNIKIEEPQRVFMFFCCFCNIGGSNHKIIINGDIKDRVSINTPTSVICGNVGSDCQIYANASIQSGNVGDRTKFRTSNSKIRSHILGKSVIFETSNGGIETSNVGEGSVLSTSNGSIKAGEISQRVQLSTSNGTIQTGNIAEFARLNTSNGSIDAGYVKSNVVLDTSNGNISVQGAEDSSKFRTSNGNIRIGRQSLRRRFSSRSS